MSVRHAAAVAVALVSIACDRSRDAPPGGAEPSATASAMASAAPTAAPQPWYEGAWTGTYEARAYLIEMDSKLGGVRQWEQDDGGRASGTGEIAMVVDSSRAAAGTAKGPLGPMIAAGMIDGDVLRLTLRSDPPGAEAETFHGLAVLQRTKGKEEFRGDLQASSGDSYTVRDAPVVIVKGSKAPPED